MKKNIIATFIGTLILFGWQFVSWMALPIHKDTLKYTAQQEEIITMLQKNIPSDGFYSVPGHDPSKNLSFKEMEAAGKESLHKPWALVLYNSSFEGMSAPNMIGGILMNLVAVVLAIILLHACNAQEKTFGSVFRIIMILPVFCIFQAVLENANWWAFPWHFIKGTVFDLIIGWALCGFYLAWQFKKPNSLQV